MGTRVSVVTDSTASLPADVAAATGLRVVPLHVVLDGEDLEDDEQVRAQVAERLRSGGAATTSQATPEELERVYATLAAEGAEGIVSVHLSGELSGTAGSAAEAARSAPVPVEVVDTRTVGMGTGFAAIAAVRAAAGGTAAAASAARATAESSGVFFAVRDLGYLRRGGRIGAAQAFVGSVLGARPVLRVVDGRIGVAETVRGAGRAARRLVELAREAMAPSPGATLSAAVHHFDAGEEAEALAAQLAEGLAEAGFALDDERVLVAEVTAVVGVHTGPGVLGVVVTPVLPADPDAAEVHSSPGEDAG